MASSEPSNGGTSNLPRGLIGRRGLPTGRGTRLPSIRAPRDLTLGGVPKKTFTPNIPIRREKIKETDTGSENRNKSRDRKSDKGRRGRDHDRGRGHGRNDYIQSASIFQQGPADRINIRASGGYTSRHDDYASSSKLDRSKAYQHSEVDDDKIKQLLEDDEDYDDDDEIADKNFIPVVLPMKNVGNFLKKEIKEENFDDEVVHIKEEPDEEAMALDGTDIVKKELSDSPRKDVKPQLKSLIAQQKLPEKIINCRDIFCSEKNSENGELLFFQLPDYFPCILPSEDVKPKVRQEPGNTGNTTTAPPEDEAAKEKKPTFTLTDLPQGFIGKLQVLKSGKTRLILGNIPFIVEVGSVGNFLQDLASIKIEDTNGDLAILGNIRHRLVCCPDIENYVSR